MQYIHVRVCTQPVSNSHTRHLELYCFPRTLLATLVNNIWKQITCDYIFARFALIATWPSALPQFAFACFCFCQLLSNDRMSSAQTQYTLSHLYPGQWQLLIKSVPATCGWSLYTLISKQFVAVTSTCHRPSIQTPLVAPVGMSHKHW